MMPLLSIFMFKDYVEILFFSALIYSISCWLLYDQTKKLIPYFYLYIITLTSAHYYALPTITFFLLLTIPGVIGLFVIMHQETLQKNLIGLKNITDTTKNTQEWTDTLMQIILYQINRKKDMVCIIEKSDALESFITASFELHAPFSADLLTILCDSPSYNPNHLLWITHQGVIKGINGLWHAVHTPTTPLLYEATRLHSQTQDVLFFHAQAVTNQATIIKNGTIEKNLSITQLHHVIKKNLSNPSLYKKGLLYERKTVHSSTQKPST